MRSKEPARGLTFGRGVGDSGPLSAREPNTVNPPLPATATAPRRRWLLLLGLLGFVLAAAPAGLAADGVVLSEFMAANTRTLADEDRSFEDWIELRNTSASAVNLEGWALANNARRARPWVFPSTNLPPGGLLLVWASGKDRRVPGRPLHTHFRLAATGEPLVLLRPDGSAATAFEPAYPPQWPDVSFGFLPGSTTAVFFPAPTPGRANETTPQRPGPFVAEVKHAPERPSVKDPIRVSARVVPAGAPVTRVTLHWRAMFGAEARMAMTDGGDGLWSAVLPAGAARSGQMLRWRIEAEDERSGRTWHPPATNSPHASQYFGTVVDAETVARATPLPVIHLFLPPAELDAAESENGAHGCLAYDGELYDRVFVKVRGNTTAGFPKRSHRLEFPADHPFRHPSSGGRIRHTSLMAEWGDPTYLRQHLSFWLQAETGSAAPFHDPVRVQLNGAFWQLAMHSEVLGEELLARHGLDPRGALYKAVGTLEPWGNSTGGFEKKTRRHEGNEDYVELAQALADNRSVADRRRALFDRMNLPATINYLAVARLTQEDDDIWANLSLYHDNDGSGEWRPVPFDMNVSWGFSFASGSILATRDAARSHPFFGAADSGMTQGFNRLYDAVVRVPETREMLLRRMRTVMDRWWQPPGTPPAERVIERHIGEMTRRMAADAVLDRAAWGNPWMASSNPRPEDALALGVRELVEQFIEPRRRHFFVTHSITNANRPRPVGITSRTIAGIPLPQPADARLDFDRIEVRPDQPRLGFLRFTNAQPFAVDVSGWTVSGKARFTFAPGTVVPGHGTLDVASDVRALRRAREHSAEAGRFVVGPLLGVPATNGPVQLRDERGRTVGERAGPGSP